ncbi:MAG TPA: hypothetical protein VMP01_19665 [Pirellulaceae bacterium]|nr:hypothetical protein [Pirellulaceae bacterium]
MNAKGVITRLTVVALGILAALPAWGQEFEQAPILYSQSALNNRVSRLIDQIKAGEKKLAYEEHFGYLRSLLKELEVPVSSQVLVFSKTSLQRNRIAPHTPRSIYFSDEVSVGFCQSGDVLELTAEDPQLGTVFYTVMQDDQDMQPFTRQTDNCLICHGSSQTKEVPGHVVRSVFTDTSGMPLLAAGTHRIDQTSPLEKRWGGWYVTGTHGEQKHLGNLVIQGRSVPRDLDNSQGQNVTDLSQFFDPKGFLSPHSDIVALMVLEHQADAHNYITRANFLTRQALHYQQSLNKELKEPAENMWDSTKSRLKSASEPLVEYMLFSGEVPLTGKITGTSKFADEFAQRGERDKQGRSLRDFDLEKRIFKYPCSYLIYSGSFAALPKEAKDYVLKRLYEVLTGQDQSKPFAHLSAADRLAILEILRDTLPDLPDYWMNQPAPAQADAANSGATSPAGF